MEDNKVRCSGLMRAFLNQRHSGVQMRTYLKEGQTEESVGSLSLGSQVGGGPRFFFFFLRLFHMASINPVVICVVLII